MPIYIDFEHWFQYILSRPGVNLEMSTSILSFCLPIRSSWRRWTTWWKWEIEASISSLSLLKLRSKVGGRDIFLCKVEIRKGPNRDIWHQDLAFRINFDGILIRHSLQRWLQAPSQSWCHKLPHALPDIFNISQDCISHGGTCVGSGQTSQSQWRRPLLPVVGQTPAAAEPWEEMELQRLMLNGIC